jgi:hypothetical protein
MRQAAESPDAWEVGAYGGIEDAGLENPEVANEALRRRCVLSLEPFDFKDNWWIFPLHFRTEGKLTHSTLSIDPTR